MESKHFTQKTADVNVVKNLYRKIFPTLCQKDTEMHVYGHNWASEINLSNPGMSCRYTWLQGS